MMRTRSVRLGLLWVFGLLAVFGSPRAGCLGTGPVPSGTNPSGGVGSSGAISGELGTQPAAWSGAHCALPEGRPAAAAEVVSGNDWAAPGKPVASDEKRKVPKERKSKKKGEEGKREESDDEDEGGGFFGDCLEGLFLSVFCGGDDEGVIAEPEPVDLSPPGAEGQSLYSVHGTEIPFSAVIVPASPGIEIVNLWSSPGGPESDGMVVTGLERGTRVEVVGLQYAGDDQPWLWVNTVGSDQRTGWVHADNVVPEHLYQPITTEYLPGEPEYGEQGSLESPAGQSYRREPSTWDIVGGMGWSPIESQLRGEFGWSGVEGRVAARFFPIENLELGLGAGYTRYWGTPEFDYETYHDGHLIQVDMPMDSDLGLLCLDGEVGGRVANLGGGMSPWSILVTLEMGVCRVSQQSKIDFVKYGQDGTITGGGQREDVMTRWRGFMGLTGEIDHTFSNGLVIGFRAGMQGIYWKSKEKESLILDWLKGDTISSFHCGLSVGYAME